MLLKRFKLSIIRLISFENLKYTIVIIVNKIVLLKFAKTVMFSLHTKNGN